MPEDIKMNPTNDEAKFGLIIDGQRKFVPRSFPVLDPITQRKIHFAPAADVNDALEAVRAAEVAFEAWQDSTPLERRTIMLKAADIIRKRSSELVEAMVLETGAKQSWATFNIETCVQLIHEAAAMATQIKGELLQSNSKGTTAMVFKEPCGVVLGIAPWNAPIILGTRAFVIPIICGNTAVLKASEASPYTQYLIVDSFLEAGLPDGVLNYICCPRKMAPSVTENMIGHPAVQRVNFTGSTAVGRMIATLCARYLKPAMLELGGKAPMVILKDANLEEAVRAAAFGAMQHQGQICMSTERIIVHQSVFAMFAELLATKINSMHAADPSKDGTMALGSLISPIAGTRVENLVTDALSKGAKVRGGKIGFEGAVVQPIVLEGVSKGMDIYYQESFGPVVSLFEFETTQEAINLANDTDYGLVCSVFSENISEALAVGRKIRTGSCHINGATVHDEPHLPLGGQKASGYGRFGGSACINEFTEDRVVTISAKGGFFPI
ncbi:Vanillin dehydrogenase [Fusarium acutatum]|uniref:Vanillin dehydrogenase n=1 Tax=Fusarium acutatum TaxID=78861 RepID=A0A8H4JGG0_9HYPO|nr:Vanillin dehydrogenase [Fusarium acutatum]